MPSTEVDPDARKLLDAAGGLQLARAIARVEGLASVSLIGIAHLGLGTPSGIMLKDCVGGQECADAVREISIELIKRDKRLPGMLSDKDTEEKRFGQALLVVCRLVRVLVDAARPGRPQVAAGGGAGEGPAYITTMSEEERGYSIPTYNTEEMKGQMLVLNRMYNVRLRPYEVGSVGALKKLMYWVKVEWSFPDPVCSRMPARVLHARTRARTHTHTHTRSAHSLAGARPSQPVQAGGLGHVVRCAETRDHEHGSCLGRG
jgi:hypothetical protein